MRAFRPLGLFTAALLASSCQSLLLDDLPDKPQAAAPAETAKAGIGTGRKSVVIRSRRDQSLKEIGDAGAASFGQTATRSNHSGAETAPQAAVSVAPPAKPNTDAVEEIGSFFSQLFGGSTTRNQQPTAREQNAPTTTAATTEPQQTAAANPAQDGPPPRRVERRYSAAYGVYKPLADKGHAFAQYELALMHLHGYGVAADSKEAERWFRKAALQGHSDAKTELRKLIAGGTLKARVEPEPVPVAAAKPTVEPGAKTKPKLTQPVAPEPKQEEDPPTVVISANSVTTMKADTDTDPGTIVDRILPRRKLPDFRKNQDEADLTKETGQLFSNKFGDGTKAPPPTSAEAPRPTHAPVATVMPDTKPDTPAAETQSDVTTSVKIVTTQPARKSVLADDAGKTDKSAADAPTPSAAHTPEKEPSDIGDTVLVEPKQVASAPALGTEDKPVPTASSSETETGDESGRSLAQDGASFSKGLAAYRDGDFKTAYRHWHPLAAKGEAESQTRLGYLFEHGKGIDRNYDEAVAWYRKAAEQGEPAAQFNLGVMYRKGRGVSKDDKVARSWYEKAARQGHPVAVRVVEVMKAYKIGE